MNAVEITDAEIRAYLLGAMAAERAETIDELTFVDADFAAHVDAVERDLVDEYHRSELDAGDRQRFEEYYLSSPLRRERAGFGSSFREYVDARPKANHIRAETADETKASWFTAWWKIGFAAAAAAILIGVAVPLWFNSSTDQQANNNPPANDTANDSNTSNQQMARSEPEPVQDPPIVDPEVRPSEVPGNSKPVNGYTPQPPPAPRVFALSLMPQTRGAQGEKVVSIPEDAERVAVTLRLEATEFRSVKVDVQDRTSGRSLWQGRARPAGSGAHQSVGFQIPRKLLARGTYGVIVTGIAEGAEPEVIGDYTFRIVR